MSDAKTAAAGPRTRAPSVWVAQPREAAAVAGLLSDFRDWMGRAEPSDGSLRAGIERLLAGGDAEYLLAATRAGEPAAGICQLRYRECVWLAGEDCWLEDLFVRDSARGSGVGAALVEAAVRRARERGCGRVELDTSSENAAALALYERFGFSAAAPEGGTGLLLRRTLASTRG